MSKIKKCAECQEDIEWNEDVIIGENGKVYHGECVDIYPTGFSLHNSDGEYLTFAEEPEMSAVCVLDLGEYIDVEDE
ncbi:hypothetical protein [Carnobacterium antarcticum]|uniref:Phage protein n=1 Tax=Carnobacterium antarcticum TaxID=2126436 RepID=A0ABW4NNI1_9LACT|nr:hypothetical protein [Carnobacterium sp. CP1]ALV20734.1 hypothetical protein NY10_109 [Carnobacterium sp. CP1]